MSRLNDLDPPRCEAWLGALGVRCEHVARHRGYHCAGVDGEPLWWRGDVRLEAWQRLVAEARPAAVGA